MLILYINILLFWANIQIENFLIFECMLLVYYMFVSYLTILPVALTM
jgi:hypothetical protein